MALADLFQERQMRRRSGVNKSRLKLLTTAVTVIFVGFIVILIGFGLLFAWYAKDLPRPDKVRRVDGLSTVISDRNGEGLYEIFEGANRIPVQFEEIPEHLRNATVAVEDKSFYQHQGLSTAGIMRAMINIVVFRNMQGGSTLTQQLVKNVLLTNEQTVARKIKEAVLAIQIERKYTKNEILQMYLNEAPYGGTAVGVESASQLYFSKHVKDLNLVESIILAGLPQSPTGYSPFGNNPEAYIPRAQAVARRMREDGYITAIQETEVRDQLDKVEFSKGEIGLRASHFVEYVRAQLLEKFGEKMVESGGLNVTTSLDWGLQEKTENIVKEEIAKLKPLRVTNGAAVVLDPTTGEILAMVGSKDYNASESGGYKFNVVTQGLRQPGSAIKPIAYAAALKKGYTAATVLMDVETKYPSGEADKPEYNPKNYDGKYRGPVLLRNALGNSINTIAVKITALVGIRDVLRLAYDMGLPTLEPTDENLKRFGLSIALGGGEVHMLELANAYGVLATGGFRHEPVSILKVVDAKGKVIYEHKTPTPKRVLEPEIAFIISSMLSDNNARKDVFGERSLLVIPGKTVAVKTGTTDDKRDNWTVGYTKHVVVATWVGNNDNSPMHPSLSSGITGAAPLWNKIIKEALKDKKDEPFDRPDGIVEMDIDAYAGGLPVDGGQVRKEVFIKGTEPTQKASVYQDLRLSKKDNNKLANSVEITKGEYDSKSFLVFTELDPVSSDGKNRWQEGIDAWAQSQSDNKFKPPKEVNQSTDQISVSIKEPNNGSRIDSNTVHIRAESASLNDVSKIEIYVDGVLVADKNDRLISQDITLENGQRTIKAKATDSKGNTAEAEVKVAINEPFPTPKP